MNSLEVNISNKWISILGYIYIEIKVLRNWIFKFNLDERLILWEYLRIHITWVRVLRGTCKSKQCSQCCTDICASYWYLLETNAILLKSTCTSYHYHHQSTCKYRTVWRIDNAQRRIQVILCRHGCALIFCATFMALVRPNDRRTNKTLETRITYQTIEPILFARK